MSFYPRNVSHVFEEVVRVRGDQPALIWADREIVTLSQLDNLANKAAVFLRSHGVGRGDRVGIRLDKCNLAYAVIIGCLKIGAPYFVIDPANPALRVSHILHKCLPKLVFSTGEPPLELPGHRVVLVDPESEFAAFDGIDARDASPDVDVIGTDAAYIMFTSGSTGTPKGAVMSHANLLNFIQWAKREFTVGPADIFTSVNPLYFDNSVFDFYASIMNGAALAPFDAATMRDPYLLLHRIEELRCTIYFSVPSLLIYFQTLRMVTDSSFSHLRTIIFGGEGYPKTKLKELFHCLHPRVELVNVYGPTECTCICSAYRITKTDFADFDGYAPLGGPIANFSFTILNERDEKSDLDEIGELCLGGPCVGLGYFNEPELTRDVFRQNPLNLYYHERIYATGDLVRRAKRDNKIHFVGRKDSQIKHQGYRIELGEIEHALCRVSGIDEAVALHNTRNDVSQIVAVVASRRDLRPEAIRTAVSTAIPAYMVPTRIDVLESLPKNSNGKVDRKALKLRYC